MTMGTAGDGCLGRRRKRAFSALGFFSPTLLSRAKQGPFFLPLSTFSAVLIGLLGGFKGS